MTMAPTTRTRSRRWRPSLSAAAALVAAMLVTPLAGAADESIAVGEVTPPPAGSGIDASLLRDAAVAEIRQIDPSRLRDRRKVVVSFALTGTGAVAEKTIACTVNAMVRDARTGAMIGIIEAGAHADGPASAELRKQVARAAVRSAVRRIPRVLGVK
ncbi:MAG: hypothetical protein KF764_20920 [Labilithrix sp.]|nr:hypothetical protein [Labilithrix sp.]